MSRNKAIALYLLGTLGQIWMICIIVFALRRSGMTVDYTTFVGMAAIGALLPVPGFFCVVFNGKFLINSWYVPFILFFKAILFGGIEEVGWRYVFQPILQERRSYIMSTIITFCAWGLWHFSYFYIEGTLSQVQGFEFLVGLLVNCFILSALYIKTNSLWICVMTHSLINVLSQLAIGGNHYVSYICKVIIIVTAVAFSKDIFAK